MGIRQSDSLNQDVADTLDACERLIAERPALLATERSFLRDLGATAVLSDIAAIPLAAAADLGLQSVAMSNFTWSWIYRDLAEEAPGLRAVAEVFAADYARADVLLRLPFHGEMDEFARVLDVPMVTRAATRDAADVRRTLGLEGNNRLVLVTFGGLGPARIDLDRLATLQGYTLVITPPAPHPLPSGLHLIDNRALIDAGLRYADLVQAADVVVSKPGYGIVSECIASGTRLLYTSRGRFAEYPVLVSAIERWGVGRFISNHELESGDWGAHLDALMAEPRRPCSLAANGAEVVARFLLGGEDPRRLEPLAT